MQPVSVEAVQQLLSTNVDAIAPETLVEVITPTVLEALSTDQQEALIEALDSNLDELSETQLEQVSQALSAAPAEVKKTFEGQINVFGGGFDTYIPVGSTISVGERRSVIAATAAVGMAAAAATTSSQRRK